MINRELIRLKLVQVLYSHLQKGSHNPDASEKELLLSLDKAYDLYNYMLLLMVEVGRMSVRMFEVYQNRSKKLNDGIQWSRKFVDNRFILQLESNKQLRAYCDEQALSWADHEDFVRNLYYKVEESDFYKEYMASETSTYEEDREIWRLIYRRLIVDNEELAELLEDINVYWNDDKTIIDTFVLKTIKRFEPDNGAEQELLPEYRDDEDKEFARKLFRQAITNAEAYRNLMSGNTKKWDLERLAFMDILIMQVALAEILSFPTIPVSVSLNEYVEIAKVYSTPKSGSFINGMLDTIVNQLKKENKLSKA